MSLLPKFDGAGRLRWLFVTSLVLNVFFVGAAGAVAFRYSGTGTVPLSNVAQINRDVANRLKEIAASLPAADAEVLRSAPVGGRFARQPAGGPVRRQRAGRRHGDEPRGAGKLRTGPQRRARHRRC